MYFWIPKQFRYNAAFYHFQSLNCAGKHSFIVKTTIAIIGAGPAGASTSIFLSKAGIDHVLLDKAVFPRDKVCGDGCSGKTVHVLRKADPTWVQELFADASRFTPSKGVSFVAPNGRRLDIEFGAGSLKDVPAPGFTAARLHFDDFLFRKTEHSCATVLQDAAVERLDRTPEGIRIGYRHEGIEKELLAQYIVGADGDKSIIRKTFLDAAESPKAYSVGLRAYYSGVRDLHPGNYIELHFLPEVMPGYFWIFPMANGLANVGIGMLSKDVRRRKINLRETMLKAIGQNPWIRQRFEGAALQGKIQGWGLPLYQRRAPLSGDRYLLTGDAGSLIDPFTGEGIGNALYSGMLAAESLQKAISSSVHDARSLQQLYDAEWYRRMGSELRSSQTMQFLSGYPWLFNLVVGKAIKSPSLGRTISAMLSNADMREQFRKPSFYFNILFNR